MDDIVPLGPLRGTEEIVAFFRELFAAVPDMEMTVTRVVAGETQAVVEWRMTGNFTGSPFQGIDPTGRRSMFAVSTCWRSRRARSSVTPRTTTA